jgi:hypothetical protein
MAEPNQPKKETVRIASPTQAGKAEGSAEAARINLPARPPVNVPPPPNPTTEDVASPVPPHEPPRKETARIPLPTEPPSGSAAVQMKKTQPLFTMPEAAEASATPLTVTSDTEAPVETMPLALCWTVLAVSALLLIIQIWNYFS